jgi:hypothetical protein
MAEEQTNNQESTPEVTQEVQQDANVVEEKVTPQHQDVADEIEQSQAEDFELNSIVDDILNEEESSDTETEEESLDDTEGEASDAITAEELENLSDEELDALADEILDEEDVAEDSNKDGFKKGLQKVKDQRDSLEQENNLLKERLDKLEAKLEAPEVKQEVEKPLSDQELTAIVGKYMEEGDSAGVMDVFKYMMEENNKVMENKYIQDQQAKTQAIIDKQLEWETIRKDYSPEMYDNEALADNPDFDINNNKSALYTLADEIYRRGIKENKARYSGKGGMLSAVEDAFLQLVKKLVGKSKVKSSENSGEETEGLANRLAKEQRKKTVASGKSSLADKAPKEVVTDDLADYMRERSQFKRERLGIPS